MEHEFSKELYDVFLKTTYPIEIAGTSRRNFVSSEISNFNEIKELRSV